MSEMLKRIADAILAKVPEGYGMTRIEAETYARAAIEAIDKLHVEQAGPYQWTKVWWDVESGTIRKTVINAEDVRVATK